MTDPNEAGWPYITVMIPSIARDERLEATLCDLARQTYPDWECIVVLQGDAGAAQADKARRVLGRRVRLFQADEPNASLARNIGLLEARGDVVLFLDDDVVIDDPEFLRHHASHYLDPSVPGVVGQVCGPDRRVRDHRHWLSRRRRNGWLYFPGNFNGRARVRNGGAGNLSVRRSWAMAVGGMDAQFDKGAHREESDFCLRFTDRFGLLVFDPEATLIHLGEPSGGCRSWGTNSGVHPLHHVTGEWYFTLNGLRSGTIRRRDLPFQLTELVRRQILNEANRRSLHRSYRATLRCFEGLRAAQAKLRAGPRLVSSVGADIYRTL